MGAIGAENDSQELSEIEDLSAEFSDFVFEDEIKPPTQNFGVPPLNLNQPGSGGNMGPIGEAEGNNEGEEFMDELIEKTEHVQYLDVAIDENEELNRLQESQQILRDLCASELSNHKAEKPPGNLEEDFQSQMQVAGLQLKDISKEASEDENDLNEIEINLRKSEIENERRLEELLSQNIS